MDRLENDSPVAMLVVVVAAACFDAVLLALVWAVAAAIDDFDTMTSKRKKQKKTILWLKGSHKVITIKQKSFLFQACNITNELISSTKKESFSISMDFFLVPKIVHYRKMVYFLHIQW